MDDEIFQHIHDQLKTYISLHPKQKLIDMHVEEDGTPVDLWVQL